MTFIILMTIIIIMTIALVKTTTIIRVIMITTADVTNQLVMNAHSGNFFFF